MPAVGRACIGSASELEPLDNGGQPLDSIAAQLHASMAVSAVSVLLVCLAAALPAVAPLTYHQGGYNQLQIALSPQTPLPANCSMMLDHFEVL